MAKSVSIKRNNEKHQPNEGATEQIGCTLFHIQISMTEAQKSKQADIDLLRKRYTTDVRNELKTIDYRLVEYFDDLITHVSTMFGDTNDRHNRYVLSPLWQGGGYKAGVETTNYTN